jgi:asparagine synthase (glutamine-hydrolysing)
MNHITGHFSLQNGILSDISRCDYSFENDKIAIRILGHLYGIDKTSIGPAVFDLFTSYNVKITSHLSGVYLLLVYDKDKHALHFFHGLQSYSLALYYTVNNGNLYYSTSLKHLLAGSQIPREFDEDGLRAFLMYGFVADNRTIVQNVFKMEPFKSLSAANGIVQQIPAHYTVKSIDEDEAEEMWNTVLERAIVRHLTGEEEINMSLSSGYDSNYILHVTSRKAVVPINIFSIGGKSGVNELPSVEKIVANYDNINLSTAYSDSTTLRCLPDIVWRLEGAIYQRGVFLQYELARLLRKENKAFLICGECADEVMNERYLDSELNTPSSEKSIFDLTPNKDPYQYGNNMVMKKTGIMANSFDIEVRYPYLDDDFISVANALRHRNGTNKQFHRNNCNQILDPGVLKNLSHKGGTTDVISLFDSASDIGRFICRVKRSDFYRSHSSLLHSIGTIPTGESILRRSISIIPDFIAISDTRIGRESFKRTEIALRQYLSYAYLDVFNRLIISGKFDELFDCDGIDVSLDDSFSL